MTVDTFPDDFLESLAEGWQEPGDAICQTMKAWGEALEEVASPIAQRLWETLKLIAMFLQRTQLLGSLRRWHVPFRVAWFIAMRWPERWLPEPDPECWTFEDNVEEEET